MGLCGRRSWQEQELCCSGAFGGGAHARGGEVDGTDPARRLQRSCPSRSPSPPPPLGNARGKPSYEAGVERRERVGGGLAAGRKVRESALRPSLCGGPRAVALVGPPGFRVFLNARCSAHVGASLQAPVDHERSARPGGPTSADPPGRRVGGEGCPRGHYSRGRLVKGYNLWGSPAFRPSPYRNEAVV